MLNLMRRLLRGLFQQGHSITQKTARGAAWVVMGSGFEQLLGFVQTLILVRLLSRLDFGVFRVTTIVLVYCRVLAQVGITQALIQRKEVSPGVLNTAWLMEMARNFLQCAALFLLAGPAAAFFKEPAIAPVLRVVALTFVFQAFLNPGVSLVGREMNFKRIETFERSYNLIAFIVTVTMAFLLRSYWAFVIGAVVLAFVNLIGSYLMSSYRPRLQFNRQHAKELLHFGKHIYLRGIIGQLAGSLDGVLLGRLLGVEALGVYGVVKGLAVRPLRLLLGLLNRVTFPAYSRLHGSPERLRGALLRVLAVAGTAAFPVYAGLALLAPGLIGLLLTPQYMAGVTVFRVFCGVFALSMIPGVIGPAFTGAGKPQAGWLAAVLSLAALVPALAVLAPQLGAEGAAAAQFVRAVALLAAFICLGRLYLGLRGTRVFAALSRPAVATGGMASLVVCCRSLVSSDGLVWLLALASVGVVAYALLTWLVNRRGLDEIHVLGRSLLAPDMQAVETPGC